MGKSYFIGTDKDNTIKFDIYYTDDFVQSVNTVDNIRMATVEEIIAMKVDVVQRGGRKRIFGTCTSCFLINIDKMLELKQQRYPYSHEEN